MQLRWQDLRGAHPADRVVDFSHAGYRQSEVPLPLPTQPNMSQMLQSTFDKQDRTADIQAAIDECARHGGGTVHLSPGPFLLSGDTLRLHQSRVTLQGHASSQGTTVLEIAGKNRNVFEIGVKETQKPKFEKRTPIIDDYVPSGTRVLHVEHPATFRPGMPVAIERKASEAWIQQLNMDKLVRNGKPQTWVKPGTRFFDVRTVVAVNGNAITLDAPFSDNIHKGLMPGATLARFVPPADAVEEVGLSNLQFSLQKSQCSGVVHCEEGVMQGIIINQHALNCWVRQCSFFGFNSSINIQSQARQITVQGCAAHRDAATDKGGGYPADFAIAGDQILMFRCSTVGEKGTDSISPAVQSRANLVAIVGHKSTHSYIQTHQRWATGVLVDGCDCKDIELVDRGNKGSGQGLSASNSIVWNCRGWRKVNVDSTPLSINFAVGCVQNGEQGTSSGQVISFGQHVQPYGLFAQQLLERIGRDAAQAVLGMQI